MNIKEKYNHTINLIEKLSADGDKDLTTIANIVAKENALNTRDMSTVFNYILGTTFKNYISGRKLNAAYHCLIQPGRGNTMNRAIALAGYSDQPSFSKAFKRKFGVSPGEVSRHNDDSRLEEPATWDTLGGSLVDKPDDMGKEYLWHSNTIKEEAEEKEAPSNVIDTPGNVAEIGLSKTIKKTEDDTVEKKLSANIFGISEREFEIVSKALEYESFYGLPRMFSIYAYDLSVEKGYALEDCFKYADSLHEFGGDFEPNPEDYEEGAEMESALERLHALADNDTIQEVFFARKISVSVIKELICLFGATKDQLLRCNNDMLKKFPGMTYDIHFSFYYYLKAYEYFNDNYHGQCRDEEEAFNYYLDRLVENYPIEDAFESVIFDGIVDDGLEDLLSGKDDGIDWEYEARLIDPPTVVDRMEEEQEQWNGDRIDDDFYYDSDNTGYDDHYGSNMFF